MPSPTDQRVLDYYTAPGAMTSAGRHASRLRELPRDAAALAGVAQGLLIHEHLVSAYGVTLTDERRATVHLRPAEAILDRVVAEDGRALAIARPAAARIAGNCRHFTVLMVTMLRAQGVPARARCGFGDYFGPDAFEDHWVCERWLAGEARWSLVDAQVDRVQRALFGTDLDVLDVPRDRFLVAGDAWARCRAGEDDPARYGLTPLREAGLWWIASNLVRDAAALGNLELLPWDVWGAMPGPDDAIDDDLARLLDRLAALTRTPDAAFDERRALCERDERLRVPPAVWNAVERRMDDIVGQD